MTANIRHYLKIAWLYIFELTLVSISIMINIKDDFTWYYIVILNYWPAHAPNWAAILEERDVHVVVAGQIFNITSVVVRSTAQPQDYLSITIIVVIRCRYGRDCRGPRAQRAIITPGRWLQRLVPGLLSLYV